jgi:alanine racemase
VPICIPLKANGYGHGLIEMGLAAERFGVDQIGVALLSEGVALRQAGVKCPILVFGAIHENQIGELIEYGLEFSISSRFKAEKVAEYCLSRGVRARVHVEVDTGMQRTGMRPETALSVYREMRKRGCFDIVGIYSHLATSDFPDDPFAKKQIELFGAMKKEIEEPLIWHMANSGGVCFYPESHFDMVRPGLLCYGYRPDGGEDEEIKPLFSLRATISYFKVVAAGQGVSYGHLYRTQEQTRVVTVPVGYGDGYRRSLSNRAEVLIGGKNYTIAGRICMDQFMVDIGQNEAYVGDEVTLIGRQGEGEISLLELARLSDTDPREILCHFNTRIPRFYRNE